MELLQKLYKNNMELLSLSKKILAVHLETLSSYWSSILTK